MVLDYKGYNLTHFLIHRPFGPLRGTIIGSRFDIAIITMFHGPLLCIFNCLMPHLNVNYQLKSVEYINRVPLCKHIVQASLIGKEKKKITGLWLFGRKSLHISPQLYSNSKHANVVRAVISKKKKSL